MSTPTAIDVMKYLDPAQAGNSQKMIGNYFFDIIRQSGVVVNYFRQDTTFPNDLRDAYEDLIYEENYPTTFSLSAELPVYLEVNTDAFVMTKYGLEPDQHYTSFFMIKDFAFAFASLAQQHVVSSVINFTTPVSAFDGVLSSSFNSDDGFLSGVVSGMIEPTLSGAISGTAVAGYFNYSDYIDVNDEIALPNSYDYLKTTFSSFHGPYSGTLDASGTGSVSGTLSGIVVYKLINDFESNIFNRIVPVPKDYFSMTSRDIREQYEITDVIDRNLSPNGINPLLAKYLFACNVVRRTYSSEDGMGAAESGTNTMMIDLEQKTREFSSDKIFDYNVSGTAVDDPKSDRIYGGYGSTVSALPASENLTNTISTDNVSGQVFEFTGFDSNSSIFGDGSHIYFAPANSLIGKSFDVSGINIPVSSCSGITQLKYLLSDGNNLFFRNADGVSAAIKTTDSNPYLMEELDLNTAQKILTPQTPSSGILYSIGQSRLYSDGTTLYFITAGNTAYEII